MARITHEDVFGFGRSPIEDRFDPAFIHPARAAKANATFLAGDGLGSLFPSNGRNNVAGLGAELTTGHDTNPVNGFRLDTLNMLGDLRNAVREEAPSGQAAVFHKAATSIIAERLSEFPEPERAKVAAEFMARREDLAREAEFDDRFAQRRDHVNAYVGQGDKISAMAGDDPVGSAHERRRLLDNIEQDKSLTEQTRHILKANVGQKLLFAQYEALEAADPDAALEEINRALGRGEPGDGRTEGREGKDTAGSQKSPDPGQFGVHLDLKDLAPEQLRFLKSRAQGVVARDGLDSQIKRHGELSSQIAAGKASLTDIDTADIPPDMKADLGNRFTIALEETETASLAVERYADPNRTFDPDSAEDRKLVADAIRGLSIDLEAATRGDQKELATLAAVVNRTRILPDNVRVVFETLHAQGVSNAASYLELGRGPDEAGSNASPSDTTKRLFLSKDAPHRLIDAHSMLAGQPADQKSGLAEIVTALFASGLPTREIDTYLADVDAEVRRRSQVAGTGPLSTSRSVLMSSASAIASQRATASKQVNEAEAFEEVTRRLEEAQSGVLSTNEDTDKTETLGAEDDSATPDKNNFGNVRAVDLTDQQIIDLFALSEEQLDEILNEVDKSELAGWLRRVRAINEPEGLQSNYIRNLIKDINETFVGNVHTRRLLISWVEKVTDRKEHLAESHPGLVTDEALKRIKTSEQQSAPIFFALDLITEFIPVVGEVKAAVRVVSAIDALREARNTGDTEAIKQAGTQLAEALLDVVPGPNLKKFLKPVRALADRLGLSKPLKDGLDRKISEGDTPRRIEGDGDEALTGERLHGPQDKAPGKSNHSKDRPADPDYARLEPEEFERNVGQIVRDFDYENLFPKKTKKASSDFRGNLELTHEDYQAHHVVPFTFRNHELIDETEFDINAFENGMALPNANDKRIKSSVHRGSHPDYSIAVGKTFDRIAGMKISKQHKRQLIAETIIRAKYHLARGHPPLRKMDGGTKEAWFDVFERIKP